MSFLDNMKIGKRLTLGFGILQILVILINVLAGFNLYKASKTMEHLVEDGVTKLSAVGTIAEKTRGNARRIADLLLYPDIDQTANRKKIESNKNEVSKNLATLEERTTDPNALAVLNKYKENRLPYLKALANLEKQLDAKNNEESRRIVLSEVMPALEVILKISDELKATYRDQIEKEESEARDAANSALIVQAALGVIALIIGFIWSNMTTSSIVQPLRQALDIAERVSKGDLSTRIHNDRTDEVGELLSELGLMSENLLRIISEVRIGTQNITSASGQIATGNRDLSARTEQQASSLEETASSMEELTSTVRQNADNAKQANQLAHLTSAAALKGGEVVNNVVATMGEISESSRKISDIISVIEGIAFQTNILALNAAVEAARAGEQGRGFAVVASEVRSLAQRSATAAVEIKNLIETSVSKVEVGSTLVSEAGQNIKEVVASVQRLSDLVAEISAASNEQSSGIELVGKAITQIDDATQQNAALVEEAAAAASSLNDQANNLVRAISVFKV